MSNGFVRLEDGGRLLRLRGPLRLDGKVELGGDKSIAHRALFFGAIAEGRSELENVPKGSDVAATAGLLRELGVAIDRDGASIFVEGRGFSGIRPPIHDLYCANSGTTMRLAAGLLAGRPFESHLTGDDSLSRRPMARVVTPLRALGADLSADGVDHRPPISIRGRPLSGGDVDTGVPSAQVKASLILAALQAAQVSRISEPVATRDHSERILAAAGASVRVVEGVVEVTPSEPDALSMRIPGDVSSAAYLVAAAALSPGSAVVVEKVSLNPTRTSYLDVLASMGMVTELAFGPDESGEPVGDIRVGHANAIEGVSIGGDRVPALIDELPLIAAIAAFARSGTLISGADELRVKETDRIATTAAALREVGARVEERPDGLAIVPDKVDSTETVRIDTAGDHRIGLAFAAVMAGLDRETVIYNWDATAVSYPEFAAHLAMLAGLELEER